MTGIQFVTCNPTSALGFIRKMYPGQTIEWSDMPLLHDLIKADTLRVQDPDFHRPCQIVEGKRYDSSDKPKVDAAIAEFVANVHGA